MLSKLDPALKKYKDAKSLKSEYDFLLQTKRGNKIYFWLCRLTVLGRHMAACVFFGNIEKYFFFLSLF